MQENLLVVDPEARMTAKQALQHPWLQTFAKPVPHEVCISPRGKATACHQQAMVVQDSTMPMALQK
jgi:serine/threonine protein kinase